MNPPAILNLLNFCIPIYNKKGEHLIRSLRRDMYHMLLENVQTRICYTDTKLGTKFNNIKDLIRKSHQPDVVYYATCLEPGCVENYTGKTGRNLNKRWIDHK